MSKRLHIQYFAAMAVCCLSFGCIREELVPPDVQNIVTVRLSDDTRTVTESDGTPAAEEAALHSLRVYAFVDGMPAGHYYQEGDFEAPYSFLMDLTMYSTTTQYVDFYMVANEKAMRTQGASAALTENTTEAQLRNFSFTSLDTSQGLPMYCILEDVPITFTNTAADNPQSVPGHEGHTLLDYNVKFELVRPIGKIGVFAAKQAGESGTLEITAVTALASGTRARNYLLPQSEVTLQAVTSTDMDIAMAVEPGQVTAELAADATPQERSNPANYTPVLAKPFYVFENPYGNGGDWSTAGDSAGNVLKIDYTFNGDARTGLVYMPAIERNSYYTVCCLIANSGTITVDYSVAAWVETETYVFEFDYPTYTNPLTPYGSTAETPYPKPTVYYTGNTGSDEGTFSFAFSMTAPTGQEWQPTLLDATQGDFEVTVYRGTELLSAPYTASPEPFRIQVKALNPANAGATARLAIAYTPQWNPSGTSLLLINGASSEPAWQGSDDPSSITIRQVEMLTTSTR